MLLKKQRCNFTVLVFVFVIEFAFIWVRRCLSRRRKTSVASSLPGLHFIKRVPSSSSSSSPASTACTLYLCLYFCLYLYFLSQFVFVFVLHQSAPCRSNNSVLLHCIALHCLVLCWELYLLWFVFYLSALLLLLLLFVWSRGGEWAWEPRSQNHKSEKRLSSPLMYLSMMMVKGWWWRYWWREWGEWGR